MQRKALSVLVALKNDPYLGEELKPLKAHQVHSRSLADCRVLKIPSTYDEEVRIIYRIIEDEIEVVAVGRRQGSVVYRLAMDRLNADVPRRRVRPWRKHGSK